ncbi:MAG: efflux RND transporter periplasmic adaptor subunit [Firmicutes bacterium]|nr:efflux RND transporter periplasmic adaptor subunit [Bacillota bacterium]
MNASSTIKASLLLVPLAALLVSCGSKPAPKAAELPTATVTLAPRVEVGGMGWVAATLQSTRTARMSTRMAAQVRQAPVQEGQRVAAGTLLLSLSDEDLQGQLKAAQTGLATAQAYHRRIQNLQAQKASTPVELEQAEAQVAQAQAAVDALKSNIAYTQIRAPFAGVVQSRAVNEGDFVGPGQPLLELVGDGEQELVASVSEAESKGLKVGQKLPFTVEAEAGEALITALSKGGDALSHKGTLRAKVLKPKGLRQGSFARLSVPGATASDLQVPRSALVQRGELTGVFIAKDGRAQLRWLSLGESMGDRVAVRSGLKADEAVIDHPGQLQDQQPISVKPGADHGK